MTDYADIIARLVKLPGPDRELDRLIEETLPGVLRHPYKDLVENGYVISGDGHPTYGPGQGYLPPHYTESIDAALTLMPEGVDVHLHIYNGTFAGVFVGRDSFKYDEQTGERPGFQAQGTPAIALLIAIFKARASSKPQKEGLTPSSP